MAEVVGAGPRLTLPVLLVESWLASVFATVAASSLLLPGHCGADSMSRKPQKVTVKFAVVTHKYVYIYNTSTGSATLSLEGRLSHLYCTCTLG